MHRQDSWSDPDRLVHIADEMAAAELSRNFRLEAYTTVEFFTSHSRSAFKIEVGQID